METLLTTSSPPADVVTPLPTDRAGARRISRWFYVSIATAVLVTFVVGFGHSIPERRASAPMTARVIAHALMFSAWVILFLLQTLLVATGRTRIHRRVGIAATVLATVMVLTGPPLAVALARRGEPPGEPLVFLLLILGDLFLFAAFVAAGIFHRRRAETHKRLMLLGMISMLPPAISRWPIAAGRPAVIGVVVLGFLITAPVYDVMARRRPNAISVWGALVVLASVPLRIAIAHTSAWLAFATWLTR
jgi:hypothetical protein